MQVTVIDQRPRPLEFLDHEIVDELIHQLRKSDVTFRCGDAVEHIDIVLYAPAPGLAPARFQQTHRQRCDLVFRRPCRRDGHLTARRGRTEGRRAGAAAGR